MKIRICLILILLVANFGATAYCAPPSPPKTSIADTVYSRPAYRELYLKVASDISAAQSASIRTTKLTQTNVALADLSPISKCEVINGDLVVFVDNRPLRNTLQRIADKHTSDSMRTVLLNGLIQQTALVEAGLDGPVNTDHADRAETAARSILRTTEFSSVPFPPPSWLDKQIDKIGDAIVRLLKRIFGRGFSMPKGHVDPDVAKGILVLVLILAAALLIYLVFQQVSDYIERRRFTLGGSTLSSSLALNELEAALVSARDYAQLIRMAKDNAENKEYRTAYRLVFLAMLVLLDTTGDVRIRRSKTNWEYLSGVEQAGKQKLYDLMLPVVQEFDRIWYGFGYVDSLDFAFILKQYELIQDLVLVASSQQIARAKTTA